MSETTTYSPAPGLVIRQRISVKQNAKGEFQRDYTIEVTALVVNLPLNPNGTDLHGGIGDLELSLEPHSNVPESLELINDVALRRAEADWKAHVRRITEGSTDA